MKLNKICAFLLFLSWLILSWLIILGMVDNVNKGITIAFWLIFGLVAAFIAATFDGKK